MTTESMRNLPVPSPELPSVVSDEVHVFPMSIGQRQIWLSEQLVPGTALYSVPAAIRLSGHLKVSALEQALQQIVARHESLRTTFTEAGSELLQVIHPERVHRLERHELGERTPSEREEALARLSQEEGRKPFDLVQGPLLRTTLVRWAETEHVLLLTLHHIISDGWSAAVLIQELRALYDALVREQVPVLPELSIQYVDYSAWQQEHLDGEQKDALVNFWKQRLEGSPAVIALPTDRPRPKVRGYQGASQPVEFSRSLVEGLRTLAREENATLYMALLAAFQVLLSRSTGQTDIVVGGSVANRNMPGTEGLIGYLANIVPLRVDLSGEPSFRAVLRRVRETALEAYAHQELPLGMLIEELMPERSLGHTPIFQVIFTLTESFDEQFGMTGLATRVVETDTGTAKYDLSLLLAEGRDGSVRGRLEYSTELYDRPRMEGLVRQLREVLEQGVARPGERVGKLALVRGEERLRLLAQGQGKEGGYPREASIGQVFEQVVARAPQAVAVTGGGRELNYGELNRRAEQVARRLKAKGVGPEQAVGLVLERSVELVEAMVGVVKAGGVYLPLDPKLPKERLEYMLKDAGARVVVTQAAWQEQVRGEGWDVVVLEEEEPAPEGSWAPVAVDANSLAYVMYTSGSTGQPKGVAVTQRGVVRLVCGTDFLQVSEEDRFLQLATPSFDASTLEIWGALLNGAQLVVAPAQQLSLEELRLLLEVERISVLWLTAGLFHQMAEEYSDVLGGVRQVLAGGDVLSPVHVKRVLEEGMGGRLINGYGPTENTTFTCCHVMETPEQAGPPVPIGRPIAQTDVYVLDEEMQPVPEGVVGELYTGGDGLARGYVGRPELTAEKFVPNPHGKQPGQRLYRTGDLARWRGDGSLEFVGRADTQVKVRGFRIEIGEVEAALESHEEVKGAAVVVQGEGAEGKRLVGFVVGAGGKKVEVGEVREYLEKRLPEYMVPSLLVAVEKLPLTGNGKVDRKALLAQVSEQAAGVGSNYEAPRDETEQKLAELWEELLGLNRVGIHDDFFEAGGHSLLATQLGSRIREQFGVDLALRQLFENTTIAELAGLIAKASPAPSTGAEAPIQAVPRGEDLPLSHTQRRLWVLDQIEPGSPLYNVAGTVSMSGELDVEALTLSLSEVVARHEALRTSFAEKAGQPFQRIHPPAPFLLATKDLSGLEPAARQAEARRLSAEWAQRPFDLTQAPLLRAMLLRLEETEHQLLLCNHHIISDGWSVGVLIREMAACYSAFMEGRRPELPELPIQYADYAAWQTEWLRGERLESQLSFWKKHLAGASLVLDLPTDRPRPAVQSFRGDQLSITLPAALAEQLRAFSREHGVTLFMTLFAGFNALLSRYSRQEDVVVGTTIANRTRRELEGLIGFFVNTLAIRTDLSGAPRFTELLERVRQTMLAAYGHQDAPFELVVDAVQPKRDLSRTPVFQVLFDLLNSPKPRLTLPGLELSVREAETGASKFDLAVQMEDTEAGLTAVIEYNTELYEKKTVERLMSHYQVLLKGAMEQPEARLWQLPVVGEAERRTVVEKWNQTGREEGPELFCELFEQQVEKTPEAVAVVCGEQALSYRELNAQANRVAHALKARGAGLEKVVGVVQERGVGYLVSLLGVLKADAVYLPLDPALPASRLAGLVKQSGCQWVLCEAKTQALAQEIAQGNPVVAREGLLGEAAGEHNPKHEVGPKSLAYVLYTSGSTGVPKGAMIEHRGMKNHLLAKVRDLAMGPGEVVAQVAVQSFDVSVWQFLSALLSGGRTAVFPDESAWEPQKLLKEMGRQGVTLLETVPAHMKLILEELEARPSEYDVSALRWFFLNGEALPAELCQRWFKGYPHIPMVNAYGPTECSDDVTHYKMMKAPEQAQGWMPIHGTLPNLQLYVVDEWLQPVPLGVPGELCVGGVGVGRGYLGDAVKTAGSYVPNPFATQPGERLYRTGDLVRYLEDGTIEFLGRNDHQVKIRGIRIELGEIEAALRKHPQVGMSVVVARAEGQNKRLVAYVTPKEAGAKPTAKELAEYLKGQLTAAMVPSAFVVMEALPLTHNGKVDRKALPAPEYGTEQAEYVAPRTEMEKKLAGIWQEVLGVPRVGVSDNFFDLGGHSLIAIQVISRVREAARVELPVRALFEEPTVSGLAARVEALAASGGTSSLPPVVPMPRGAVAPLSYAQQRLWVLGQLEPHSPLYNVPGALRLSGQLNVSALERSLSEIVTRHEALRTTFELEGSQPAQRIGKAGAIPLEVVDLSHLEPGARASELQRLGGEEARKPFDLSQGPLMRARLLKLEPAEHVLLMTMHHIVSDGWSVGVFFRELGALYGAFSAGQPSPLNTLKVQYADYAQWQRQWLQGEALDKHLAYWKTQLAGVEPLDLKTDRPRGAMQGARGDRYLFRLPKELEEGLKALSRKQGTTLFMTMLAGFNALLARYTRQQDIVVGTSVANRGQAEIEELIGFFVNTLALRTQVDGNPRFTELLDRVRKVTLEAYTHQEAPFDRVVEAVQPERDLTRTPLFQVAFELQKAPASSLKLEGLTLGLEELNTGTSKFDLLLTMVDGPEGLHGGVEYNTELYERKTVERLMSHYQVLLKGAVEQPEARLWQLPVVGEAERQTVVEKWNQTGREEGPELFCELFEQQVEKTPEAVAVVCGEQALSYRELNAQANRVAHALKAQGAGLEKVVGVVQERGVGYLVSLLGVLKADAVYLPLDPALPASRLAGLVKQSGCQWVLCEAKTQALAQEIAQGNPVVAREGLLGEAHGEHNPKHEVGPKSLAYVLYTSGSTGVPKGAMIEHRGMKNHLLAKVRDLAMGTGEVVAQVAVQSFDVSVWQFLSALLSGGRTAVFPDESAWEPQKLLKEMGRQGVTLLETVPAHMKLILEELEARPSEYDVSALRWFFLNGEALPAELCQRWFKGYPHIPMVNAYGPTECSDDVTHYKMMKAPEQAQGWMPIHGTLPNLQLYVVDEWLQPVPLGVPGELCVGGVGVGRGYLGDVVKTAGSYVPNPFATQAGERLYRTGDLVRYLEDGTIEFLGRNDHQVKIRGIRIELGEIEAALRKHPQVGMSVVVARAEGQNKRLVAYVTPKEAGAKPTGKELAEYLKGQLTAAMVPSAFVVMEALPLTHNGKVDRKALPAPEYGTEQAEYVAPRTEMEKKLAGIWQEVLGVPRVGMNDNFFDLGGHSLMAIQIISKVRQELQAELPVVSLFENATVSGIAARLESLPRGAPVLDAPPLIAVSRYEDDDEEEEEG
ncbi:amino acid adenylation domain-containing protein [Stigmatella sp. ncwal1]|uniref:Amino acid adenylation domain-containing protein n=1 Tax=Stigmatella ashevillensis TaxID=2995309 RepID=A0ABT5D5Q2_9BACT|nr:non-ribosomal peptide synthetase [Stigmatella ashevillena]MDC0708183.1 amino acid adenylation domain-containing protein [Stigmatella ashevillena]